MDIQRYEITVRGIVQGVGFRPFVAKLATALHLTGHVRNMSTHVLIEVEGPRQTLDEFLHKLEHEHPPLAQISETHVYSLPPYGYRDFSITASPEGQRDRAVTVVPPDAALCPDCRRELLDRADRRYHYPFITCTNCGPRFTIVTGVPYDRERTTMERFPLCPDCAREYTDQLDRRFHAEPIACPTCGPSVLLRSAEGAEIARDDQAIRQTIDHIAEGKIVAIKGVGGYHLACNALDRDAVRRLRQRKARDEKPFAVMAASLAVAEAYCDIRVIERGILQSPAAPIVLCTRKEGGGLPDEVAPANPSLGVMLPYTPLHTLLFHESPLKLLVMTSGNIGGEPICFDDTEALARLQPIADFFLVHNREIHTRVDDSVVRVLNNRAYPIRRSRGYVPLPVSYPAHRASRTVLACGGHLKNTFCINQGAKYYLSHHIGDLENYETFTAYQQGIDLFQQMLGVTPDVIAHDLHPNYLSTQYAASLPLPSVGVQHHRAHIAACMADNGITGKVIGVAFDGTGYGDDGAIWGGEFFAGDLQNLRRIGHLEYIPIAGGDSAVAAPWKVGVAYARHALGHSDTVNESFAGVPSQQIAIATEMLANGFNVFHTSSAGRLFDAAAALIGVRHTISYEGQAAIELEFAATRFPALCVPYEFTVDGSEHGFTVGITEMIRGIISDKQQNRPPEEMAARFHETVAQVILAGCRRARAETGIAQVALSGGVFQNRRLLLRVLELLGADDFTVFIHHHVPANDGGLSLGQAVLAQEMQ